MRALFLGHEASRTGAPLLLLWWLQWLRERGELDGELWLGRSGPLVEEYRKVLPVVDLSGFHGWMVRGAIQRIFGSAMGHQVRGALLRGRLRRGGVDRAWSNTAATGGWGSLLARAGIPITCNIHELPQSIRGLIGSEAFMRSHRDVQRWIACSRGVASGLTNEFGIASDRVEIVEEFHHVREADVLGAKPQRERVRKELGVGARDFVVGMVGTMDRRKGSDVFVRLVRDSIRLERYAGIRFVWVGGGESTDAHSSIRHDLSRIEADWRCHLIPACDDVKPYLAAMDAFCLTSRVDPFPVAMLEAAAMGLPIFGFRGSGGVEDFVSNGGGVLVPYLDEAGMLEALLRVSRSPVELRDYGVAAARNAMERHTIEVIGPRLLKSLKMVA